MLALTELLGRKMFEITGDEVQRLDDAQLRTLVARLAIAELSAKALPISGVTAGGDQNAPDGGLDVRVELANVEYAGDFVPRVPLGFQVKKPDMGPAAITSEMKPKGVLRSVLSELANAGGAYIIVSSKGTVADGPLESRRAAMRDALAEHPSAHKLHIDFYDRERLATWINQYPGVAVWVRERTGRPLSGWRSLGDWSGIRVGGDGQYITDHTACVLDTRTREPKIRPVVEGINCIRSVLVEHAQCVRLIGMSGVGKTRLVQALFESDVGSDAIDPSLAIYTDYSEPPIPTAKQLALHLIETGQRAILVVDNCNPQTHTDLSNICGSRESKISLITIEYDVRDDEPERTDVFRLQAASEDTIDKWLKVNFAHVSQVDRGRIAEFSGGNFRVAGVLAETLKRGETLGELRDRELFGRIFQQRNDHSDDLLSAAEGLSLVYSFDGIDTTASSELATLTQIAGITTLKLYACVAELRRRSVVQSRGRWRAVLPHAIANRLAAQALERIPQAQLDALCVTMSPRMRKSFTRRLGYLHDSQEAKQAVVRWLRPSGLFGDLLAGGAQSVQLLRNIAPVAPEAVLQHIEKELAGPNGLAILSTNSSSRMQLATLLKSIAYEARLFDHSVSLLVKFLSEEKHGETRNSVKGIFEEIFHIHLSGTDALPAQRRRFILDLYSRHDSDCIRCANLALRALLRTGHFSSASNFEFGARPRDYGWNPPTYGDIWSWYSDGVSLALQVATDTKLRPEMRRIISASLRGILPFEAGLRAIEAAAAEFLKDSEWIEGWAAVRQAIRFDGEKWRPEIKASVLALEEQLRPSSRLNEAKAYVLGVDGAGFAFLDGDTNEELIKDYGAAHERASQRAKAIGREFGSNTELLGGFLPEALRSRKSDFAFYFGMGLAQSTADLKETWQALRSELSRIPSEQQNPTIMGGFLSKLNESEAGLCADILDEVLSDPGLSAHFVYLQAQVDLDIDAIERLRKAISTGHIEARCFKALASGIIRSAPQASLSSMLDDLCRLQDGVCTALEILYIAVLCLRGDRIEIDEILLEMGHQLLLRTDYKKAQNSAEHEITEIIKTCYAGCSGERRAHALCRTLKARVSTAKLYPFELDYVLNALFEVQPIIALDELLLVSEGDEGSQIIGKSTFTQQSPLEVVDPATLWRWADKAPDARYPLIGGSISIFAKKNFDDDDGLSPLFLQGLEKAPDKAAFLGADEMRVHPSSWSGALSDILERRQEYLQALAEHPDSNVQVWVSEMISKLRQWAASERERESEREESFE